MWPHFLASQKVISFMHFVQLTEYSWFRDWRWAEALAFLAHKRLLLVNLDSAISFSSDFEAIYCSGWNEYLPIFQKEAGV